MTVGDIFLSSDEFAEKLGTTRKTVNKLAREGKITRLRDKSFPWPKAKYEFDRYRQSLMVHQPLLAEKKPRISVMENEEDIPLIDDDHVDYSSADPIETRKKDLKNLNIGEQIITALQKHVDGSENSAYHWARALNEAVKARQSMLSLLEAESKTLKADEVTTWIYNVSRQNRDHWLQWPQRVATEMAEQLGIDSRLMNDVLMKAVRENLERNATLPISFGGASGDE